VDVITPKAWMASSAPALVWFVGLITYCPSGRLHTTLRVDYIQSCGLITYRSASGLHPTLCVDYIYGYAVMRMRFTKKY